MSEDIYPRHFSNLLGKALISFRVINLIGPRQAGKTTVVRDILDKGVYINLDDDNILEAIEADPKGVLESLKEEAGKEPVIIDEVQRSKKIVLALKSIVDRSNIKGQFILTGSSNIFTAKGVQDSLPGRVVPMQLWPFTVAESKKRPPKQGNRLDFTKKSFVKS
ncbi:MAG: AAA family ATPase, partial [Rhodobacteraceae bacterium]|nr:AAA family ATPase [Paracoccaceae bacterium]